jgi:hypothetical protein
MTQVVADARVIPRSVSAFGLPGAESTGALFVDEERWPTTLASLRSDRITGLAVACLEAAGLQLSGEQTAALLKAHRELMLGSLAVERCLLEVAPSFEEAGIEFVVMKGPALAHTVYPDPSWRFFGDLDLLVRTADWRQACAVLEDLGLKRDLPEPRHGFDERFGKACVYRRPSGPEIDLHRTLVVGPFGLWIETDRLFESTSDFRLGNRTLRRLDDTSLLLHACVHASLGWWPPLTVPVRDVAQVAHFAHVDWDALAERSARWRLRAVVGHALHYASETLAVPLPPRASAMMIGSTNRRERRALRTYITDRRALGGTAMSTLLAISGIRAKFAYIRALLLPDREFLTARGRTSYLGRWRVALRWLRGRGRR